MLFWCAVREESNIHLFMCSEEVHSEGIATEDWLMERLWFLRRTLMDDQTNVLEFKFSLNFLCLDRVIDWWSSDAVKEGVSAGALMSLWVKALFNWKYSWVWSMHKMVISSVIVVIVLVVRTDLFSDFLTHGSTRAEGLIQLNWLSAENNSPGVRDLLLQRLAVTGLKDGMRNHWGQTDRK